MIYVDVFSKTSEFNDFRVCTKKEGNITYKLILNYYLSESKIRVQLKETMNKDNIESLLYRKNQVISLEESDVSNKVLAFENLKNIDQNFDSVSELYLDENFLTGLNFLQKFPRLKILHASNF